METFTEPKELVENPNYEEQRQKSLLGLTDAIIDTPIIEIVNSFNKPAFCFSIQSCYGHFLYDSQNDQYNLDSLPVTKSIDRGPANQALPWKEIPLRSISASKLDRQE